MLAKVVGDTRFKVGTGQHTWSDLPWAPSVSGNNGLIYKDGELVVDFSQMPTDKFETLLKQLRLPIWLTKNTNFYVDGATGSDVISEGRGLSTSKAFKTIQACVSHVCSTYNLDAYKLIINVNPKVEYTENLSLPDFNKTNGYIIIQPLDFESDGTKFITLNFVPFHHFVFAHIAIMGSGSWKLYNFKLNTNLNLSNLVQDYVFNFLRLYCVMITESAQVEVQCPDFTMNVTGNLSKTLELYFISAADNSKVVLSAGKVEGKITAINTCSGGRVRPTAFSIGSTMSIGTVVDTNITRKFLVSGGFYRFANISGYAYVNGSATEAIYFEPVGTVTGTRYYVASGGKCNTNGAGPNYFPGSIDGTVESETFSWYK